MKATFLPDGPIEHFEDPRIAFDNKIQEMPAADQHAENLKRSKQAIIDLQIEREAKEIAECHEQAGPWVLSLLDKEIQNLIWASEAYEREGEIHQMEQCSIYLRKTRIAREGARMALEAKPQLPIKGK